MPPESATPLRLHDRLNALRRRKWLFILAVATVPAAALLYSLQQPAKYQASSDVLLGRQDVIAALAGTADPSVTQDPQRLVDTQTALAREPQVAQRVLASLSMHDRTAEEFLAQSSVSAQSGTNLIEFHVTDRKASTAVQLANAYTRQFSSFARQLDTSALDKALRRVQSRIRGLSQASPHSQILVALAAKEEQLQTELTLLTSNATVVRTATSAAQVEPQPVRDALLGVVVGILLGVGLVFLRESLDTRVKTAEDVGAVLHLPLLARIPRPPRRARKGQRLVMMTEAGSRHAEPFRVLRTNLEFATLGRNPRTIMVTSAVEQEGKSTTAANLAVALARAGKRVAIVDLDLRRPFIHSFFDLNNEPGLTDVALGRIDLERALERVPVSDESTSQSERAPEHEVLVLPSGPLPPDPGEFVASPAVMTILEEVASQVDVVVIDSPPMLGVGDALTLSGLVDGILLVVRLDLIRKRTLAELHRVLWTSPAEKLGFVVADANGDHDYAHYAYSYERSSPQPEEQTSNEAVW